MISTVAPSRHFGMHHRGEAAARKHDNISFRKMVHTVAYTYRRSAQFGLLRSLSLDGKLFIRDDRNAALL